jgi:hypothetical protein
LASEEPDALIGARPARKPIAIGRLRFKVFPLEHLMRAPAIGLADVEVLDLDEDGV